MIHHLSTLSISDKLYEAMQDRGDDFRFAAIESDLAAYTENYAAWHWHEAMEFAWVTEGAVDCCTPGSRLTLRTGEGYFVNSGVLHMNKISAGSKAGKLRVLQFDAGILSGTRAISGRYVQPIGKNAGIECRMLTDGSAGERRILRGIAAIFELADAEPPAFELDVAQGLLGIWKELYLLLAPQAETSRQATDSAAVRIKAMLAHIHRHFDAPMTVAEIAASANISQREAYRTFRQVLNTTPTLYLQRYRVDQAARMLTETDRPITQIGLDAGFSSPNYFNKAFKDLTGLAPREFRKKSRHG